MYSKKSAKIKEYGDFQTPPEFAYKILSYLKETGVFPSTIIEPTCGIGSFVVSSLNVFPNAKIFGIDINSSYIEILRHKLEELNIRQNIEVSVADFFSTNWKGLVDREKKPVLIIGNLPWITSSEMSVINGSNLPKKVNIYGLNGFDAKTGKSNFDISEWMSIELLKALDGNTGYFAMLCKVSVARKLFKFITKERLSVKSQEIYLIDSKRYFNVAVDACAFICHFEPDSHNYHCKIYQDFSKKAFIQEIGYINEELIADIPLYRKWRHLRGKNKYIWRSGIKHDCTKVMVLKRRGSTYINGLGEEIELEDDYLYPLLKSSDLANNRIDSTDKFMIVTQRTIGEETVKIKEKAPLTWDYLLKHENILNSRKSVIYRGRPKFSIFGVGEYSFSKWKIAIAGMYKNVEFRLIAPLYNKPVIFDDTCYFIPTNSLEEASLLYYLYNHTITKQFYGAYIFWDSKRPIKKEILEKLSIKKLIKEIGFNNVLVSIENQFPTLNKEKLVHELTQLTRAIEPKAYRGKQGKKKIKKITEFLANY